MVEIVFRPPH